jgi:protocatechuate 3,4-dioxygenase beta subunit
MVRTRRGRWRAGLVAAVLLATQGVSAAPAVTPPPPTCTNARLTPPVTEGPYYKPGSPERTSLFEPGMPGTRITVTGYVLSTQCRPVVRAWLDFWQADDRGQYDAAGYRLRGHQFTDGAGAFSLETILPGPYPGRTRHIHVKVRAPNGPTLTTQLYFPGEPRNQSDGIFNPSLVVATQDLAGGHVALFNFVVETR